jgi:hypothetical protein
MSSVDSGAQGIPTGQVPAVTVLIPAYNAGSFLRSAVDSILSQTFDDFECLVIDDGSTDGAVDALRAISDRRLRIERNPRNLGLIATLNRGIELARAPLLARMDSDDLALPTRLEKQVAMFESKPDLALLGTCATMIDEHGNQFGVIDVAQTRQNILRKILRQNLFVHPSVMMRTNIVRALGGYPASAPQAEDYALWLRFALNHVVENLGERLIQYRVHSGQVSQRKIAEQRKTVQAVQRDFWGEYQEAGLVPNDTAPPVSSRWDELSGKPGTLGADYLHWARLYRKMGNRRAAIKTALSGLRSSPLSLALLEVCLPTRLCPTYWVHVLKDVYARIRSHK